MNVKNTYVNAALTGSSMKEAKRIRVRQIASKQGYQFLLFGVVLCFLQILSTISKQIISSAFISICSAVMIYSIVSVGFCFLLGYGGLVSLGTSCFVGIGTYCVFFALQQWKVPYLVGLLLALAISLLLGLAIGFISLRIQGIFLGIITMGLSEIIRYALKAIYPQTMQISGSNLKLFGITLRATNMYYFIAAIMVLILILTSNLMRSPTGRSMLAMKNSTAAAQAFGINILSHRILAFVLACVYATLGGLCYMCAGNSIVPTNSADAVLSLTLSLNILAAVIIGGYKSIWGTIFGVVFVFGFSKILSVALSQSAYAAISPYINVIIGVLIILIIMFYPGGFAQLAREVVYKIKKLIAKRRIRTYGTEE